MHKIANTWTTMLLTGSLLSLAASPVWAESGVKVECQGDCSRVTLGDACSAWVPNSQPVSVSCDDTATPGSGSGGSCGSGDVCTPFSALSRLDRLSAYCVDGPGYDAIVICK